MSWREKVDHFFGLDKPIEHEKDDEDEKKEPEKPEKTKETPKEPTKIKLGCNPLGMLRLMCPHVENGICEDCFDKVYPTLQSWFDATFSKQQESGWTNKDVTQPFVMR